MPGAPYEGAIQASPSERFQSRFDLFDVSEAPPSILLERKELAVRLKSSYRPVVSNWKPFLPSEGLFPARSPFFRAKPNKISASDSGTPIATICRAIFLGSVHPVFLTLLGAVTATRFPCNSRRFTAVVGGVPRTTDSAGPLPLPPVDLTETAGNVFALNDLSGPVPTDGPA